MNESPCLSICVDKLKASGSEHFAIWVLEAPYPGGYVHHDCIWPESLTLACFAWQEIFVSPHLSIVPAHQHLKVLTPDSAIASGSPLSMSSRRMQDLGISLWQWLFSGTIQNSLNQSQGIAFGQHKPLRLRLEIRDPELIALPWEIMQPQAGKPAISLSQNLLFSRTTSDVDPLLQSRNDRYLNILLVLGQNPTNDSIPTGLQLEKEANILKEILEKNSQTNSLSNNYGMTAPCKVDTLLQPTPEELIARLEKGTYNIFFYAGHGAPGPDGGWLFLRPDATLNGTELAQVLIRAQVTLAVFNACWGALPDRLNHKSMPRSSLAEVLIHHGVPAVLGMRDSIADQESLTFIQVFSQALAEYMSVDKAVAMARQQLLTIYKFNQPAWTLPVLYMHPEFDGHLLGWSDDGMTELPTNSMVGMGRHLPRACLRSVGNNPKVWQIRSGLARVGRQQDNDIVIREQWVSKKHAEIFCRDALPGVNAEPTYFLRDFSSYGTLILGPNGWQKIHHQEIPLVSGVQIKFGSSHGQALEFVMENMITGDRY